MKEKIICNTKEKITEEWVKNSNVKLLQKWTLFMSFKLSLWKLAFAWERLYTNEAIAGLPIKDEKNLDKFFLYYFLLWNDFSKNWTDNSVKWATLNKEKLKQIQIPLPPLQTQQKIVEKLDNLFSKIDKNIELTKQNSANIDEENNTILEKIFTECEKEFGGQEVGKICNIITWNTPSTKFSEYYWWKILWAWPSDFWDFKIINSTKKTLTEKWLFEWKARLVKKWSVLLVSIWATIWKLWIAWSDLTTNQQINSFEISEKILWDFLYFFLKFYKKNFVNTASQTTLPIVNKTQCSKIQIPLPPLPNQQKIVEKLDKIFSANSELKNFYEKNLKNLEELKQSILKQAFEDENFIQ